MEASFFESEFTHAMPHWPYKAPRRLHGPLAIAHRQKKFPVEHLRDAKETLAKFLKV